MAGRVEATINALVCTGALVDWRSPVNWVGKSKFDTVRVSRKVKQSPSHEVKKLCVNRVSID